MTPRYELRAVRLNGEIYPAIIDHDSKKKRPFIFYAKDRPGYKDLIKLMAEYRGAQIVGLQPRDILHLPHYLSDMTVEIIVPEWADAR